MLNVSLLLHLYRLYNFILTILVLKQHLNLNKSCKLENNEVRQSEVKGKQPCFPNLGLWGAMPSEQKQQQKAAGKVRVSECKFAYCA